MTAVVSPRRGTISRSRTVPRMKPIRKMISAYSAPALLDFAIQIGVTVNSLNAALAASWKRQHAIQIDLREHAVRVIRSLVRPEKSASNRACAYRVACSR